MARTPEHYVALDYLMDHVNPVSGDVVVYSENGGAVELVTKPYALDGYGRDGWTPLPGTRVDVPPGLSAHTLVSDCLDRSEQVHVRGRMGDVAGEWALSDLHYVIIDAEVACP